MTSLQATGRFLSFSVLELIAGQDNGARDAGDARDAEKSDDDGIPKLSNPDRVAANQPTRVLKLEWKYRSHAFFLLPDPFRCIQNMFYTWSGVPLVHRVPVTGKLLGAVQTVLKPSLDNKKQEETKGRVRKSLFKG